MPTCRQQPPGGTGVGRPKKTGQCDDGARPGRFGVGQRMGEQGEGRQVRRDEGQVRLSVDLREDGSEECAGRGRQGRGAPLGRIGGKALDEARQRILRCEGGLRDVVDAGDEAGKGRVGEVEVWGEQFGGELREEEGLVDFFGREGGQRGLGRVVEQEEGGCGVRVGSQGGEGVRVERLLCVRVGVVAQAGGSEPRGDLALVEEDAAVCAGLGEWGGERVRT